VGIGRSYDRVPDAPPPSARQDRGLELANRRTMSPDDRSGEPIHIVCGFDENYAIPAGVMLRSVSRSLRPGVRCVAHLVALGVGPTTRAQLEACGSDNLQVRFCDFDPAWISEFPDSNPEAPQLNMTVYISLMADRFLPDDVERYVMLDADMIVRSSIDELACTDLEGNVIGAVRDYYVCAMGMPGGVKLWRSLGLDSRSPYFNGGLLVVDRQAWREAEVERHTVAYLQDNRDDIFFFEQEALNATLSGRWLPVHPRWNLMVAIEHLVEQEKGWVYGFADGHRIDEARTDPAIVHYASPKKPWHVGSTVPYLDDWWATLRDSPWRDFQPIKKKTPLLQEVVNRGKWAASILLRGNLD
jgi:lipopolysaccharide biosynthesis glycosyltransferase